MAGRTHEELAKKVTNSITDRKVCDWVRVNVQKSEAEKHGHRRRCSGPSLPDLKELFLRGRIDDCLARLNDSARSKASGLQVALPHDMENDLPAGYKVISDYAAVASPPHGFRTHDCAVPFMPLIE